MTRTITFRPIRPDDEYFLYEVYTSTRSEELTLANWTKDQQQTFLRMQFSAQHQYYQAVYPQADFQIILLDGQAIGRLYVARLSREIRLLDLSLLPQFRNLGIGTYLLKNLLAEASQTGQVVTILVEKFNPALRLYERLGFTKTLDKGGSLHLEWNPQRTGVTAQSYTQV